MTLDILGGSMSAMGISLSVGPTVQMESGALDSMKDDGWLQRYLLAAASDFVSVSIPRLPHAGCAGGADECVRPYASLKTNASASTRA